MPVHPGEVREALYALDYPADKDQIVAHAADLGADESVVRKLRTLPLAIYDTREQVVDALSFDRAVTDAQTMSDKAYQRRHHTTPDLAEHEKETESPPIERELGWNRKK